MLANSSHPATYQTTSVSSNRSTNELTSNASCNRVIGRAISTSYNAVLYRTPSANTSDSCKYKSCREYMLFVSHHPKSPWFVSVLRRTSNLYPSFAILAAVFLGVGPSVWGLKINQSLDVLVTHNLERPTFIPVISFLSTLCAFFLPPLSLVHPQVKRETRARHDTIKKFPPVTTTAGIIL